MDFIYKLFSAEGFMPHGHCYLWNPGVLWLHIVSDALITVAYFSIPFTLIYFVRKRQDLAFNWMFVCFAVFIVACGTTHLMEIWSIWHPTYWLSGAIKALTAMASVPTAILLVRLVPQALALPSPEKLRCANEDLKKEINERKQALEQIQELNRELQRRSTLLQAANQELEAFSYSVSHDLRAPVRHVDGFAAMLQNQADRLDDKGRQYLKTISESAKRMGALIDDLLVFSRIGRAELRNATVDLEQLVQETLIGLDQETKGRNIEWSRWPLPKVKGDPAMLRQVLINLLDNAVKYTRPRNPTRIEIGCAQETAEEVVIFVRDNGVGFDMEYVDKLFGVFQRLHRNDEFEGTGIGLANVRRIITRHGGRVWAEGKVDAGATVYFTLPKASPASP
jgi:signal transduction histidine kinase